MPPSARRGDRTSRSWTPGWGRPCGSASRATPLRRCSVWTELALQHPDSVPLRATLGDVHYELGHYRAALECYEQVLDDHPEHQGCRLGMARCLARRPLLVPEAALTATPR